MPITLLYSMATLVRALSLGAEQAAFSCNDRALWKLFSTRQLFWAVSKSYEREGEINKKYLVYNIWRILRGNCGRTIFSHDFLTYQKSHKWAQRTSEISSTKTTSSYVPNEALSMWYCVYYILLRQSSFWRPFYFTSFQNAKMRTKWKYHWNVC